MHLINNHTRVRTHARTHMHSVSTEMTQTYQKQ